MSLPYTVTFANFLFAGGRLRLTQHNELFFRTEPLRRKSDRLCYPALLNVSRIPKGKRHIAWICTQYLNCSSRMSWPEQLHALLEHLWNGAFNLSSERHEGESWYTACRSVPNLHPIEQWERESQRDDAWALNVPWLSAPISVGELIEEFLSAGETCGPLWLFSRRDTTVPIVSRFVTFSQEQGRSRRKAV
ncbi:MAG: hypothetical protein GXP27_03235 [Planctomycetes bacterium]|nr:hypothetical protein [Planctomycetota bacterium]